MLFELLKKYAGVVSRDAVNEAHNGVQHPLPDQIDDWPEECQDQLRLNISELQIAFDLSKAEAVEAAIPAVRYERAKGEGPKT